MVVGVAAEEAGARRRTADARIWSLEAMLVPPITSEPLTAAYVTHALVGQTKLRTTFGVHVVVTVG